MNPFMLMRIKLAVLWLGLLTVLVQQTLAIVCVAIEYPVHSSGWSTAVNHFLWNYA